MCGHKEIKSTQSIEVKWSRQHSNKTAQGRSIRGSTITGQMFFNYPFIWNKCHQCGKMQMSSLCTNMDISQLLRNALISVVERIVRQHLCDHLSTNGLVSNAQYGFCPVSHSYWILSMFGTNQWKTGSRLMHCFLIYERLLIEFHMCICWRN